MIEQITVEELFKKYPKKWYPFGKDKRTKHYKQTKSMQEKGADLFYPMKLKTERGSDQRRNAGDGQNFFSFYYCIGMIHFEDGTFQKKKFRITTKQFETIKENWQKKERS